jgi:hypothetical protein
LSGTPSGVTYNITGGSSVGLANQTGVTSIPAFTAVTGTATVTITPVANGCTGNSVTYTITVNPTPTATAPGNQTYCNGVTTSAISLSGTPSGVTYNITGGSSVGLANQTGVTSIPAFTAVTGTATVTITPVANGCTGNSVTYTITVNPTPTVTAPGNQTYCNGVTTSAISLSGTPSGVTYNITGGSSVGLANQTGVTSIPAFTAVTGTATVTITPVANGCTGNSVTYTVTVSPLSIGGSLSPKLQTGCQNATGNISLSGYTGTIVKWQQSTDGGATWADLSNSTNAYSYGPLAQTTSYRAVIQSGPCSVAYSDTAVVSVVPPMKPNPVTPTPRTICAGDSSVLSSGTGYPTIGLTDSSGFFNNASNSGGWGWNKCYLPSCVNAGGDNGAPTPWLETTSEKVNPPLISYYSSDNKFAVVRGSGSDWGNGDTSVLETPAFSLIGQTSSIFQYSQGYVLTTTGASISVEISTDGGKTYSAILSQLKGVATSPGLTGYTDTLKPTSISLANYIGLSNLKIRFKYTGAAGSSWALDNILLPGTLPITYQWSDTSKISTISSSTPVTQTPITVRPTVTTTYSIATYVNGCYAGQDTVTVFVNPLPTVTLGANPSTCQGSNTVSLTYTGTSNAPTKYSIQFDATAKAAGLRDSTNVSFPTSPISISVPSTIAAGTYNGTISVTNANNCGSTAQSFTITINASPTATVTGGIFCATGTNTLAVSNQTGGTPQNVNWTSTPSGLSINSSTGVINLAASTSGTYMVAYNFTGTNGCSVYPVPTATVTVNPQASFTISPANVVACPEEGTALFTVTTQTDPSFNYVWQVNDGSGWQTVSGSDYATATTSTSTTTTNTLTVKNITAGNTKDTYQFQTVVSGTGGTCAVTSGYGTLKIHNIWHGYTNTDWNTVTNWSDSLVPTLTCDSVIILNVNNKPILSSGSEGAVNHLVIRSGATVTVTGNTLHIAGGIWDDNMALDATAGKIDLNGNLWLDGTTARPQQTIAGKMFYTSYKNSSGRIMDLEISSPHGASVSPISSDNDTLNITGILSFGNVSNVTLNTGNNITLISNAAGTARVADITNSTKNSGNSISGEVIVERYFPALKSWRFLAIPTQPAQFIHDAWQEGQAAGATTPIGKGFQLTSAISGNGFDGYSVDPSVKWYNPSNNSFVGITSTLAPFEPNKGGYLTFIRGDRTITTLTQSPNETVLRTKGLLYQGDQPSVTVYADPLFTPVNNPYASPLDLRKINFGDGSTFWEAPSYIVYDPKLAKGSVFGYGAFQTLTLIGSDYYAIPGGGSYPTSTPSNFIESGQAFFTQAGSVARSINIKETSKGAGSGNLVFREATLSQKVLRTNLYLLSNGSAPLLLDGVLNQFGKFSPKIDSLDIRKMRNTYENLAISSNEKLLAVERRPDVSKQDTIFLNFTRPRVSNYQFEFIPNGLDQPGLHGFLEDDYLKTKTPISLSSTTDIQFNVENIPGSYAPDRFRIVFQQDRVLPFSFVKVNGYQKNSDIIVDWSVQNERLIRQYEIEKSVDGSAFTYAATISPDNNLTGTYNWLDSHASDGFNYYRIKSISMTGEVVYSSIVKVFIIPRKPMISIYPNPIIDGVINLQLVNQPEGRYGIRLLTNLGQVITTTEIQHAKGSSIEHIKWNYNLSHGTYHLEVTKPDGSIANIIILY